MIKHHQQFDLYDKQIFEKIILEPPFKLTALMPNEACFLYAVRGKAQMYAPTLGVTMHTEEGVFLNCGNYLNEWLESDEGGYCEAIAVHLYPEVLQKIYDKEFPEFLSSAQKAKPAPIAKLKADQLMKNYVDSLQFYFENPSMISDELLKLKIKELVLLLAKTDNIEAIHQVISSMFTPETYSFKEVIEANIFNQVTNEELAVLTNLSLSTFKREFKKAYGMSPKKYFTERRLERASKLLTHSDRRISEIAEECGFSDISHFSKTFQKHYGVSASEYRLSQITN